MSERKYRVVGSSGEILARDMTLSTALFVIRCFCEEYFDCPAAYTILEEDTASGGGIVFENL